MADPAALLAASRWLAESALAGAAEAALLEGLCRRMQEIGLGLSRVSVGIDTLHPVVGARGFVWRRGVAVDPREIRRSDASIDDRWQRSPHYHLLQTGERWLRHRIDPRGASPRPFPVLDDVAADGATDYVAFLTRFGESATIGEMDSVYTSWTTDRPGGFRDDDIEAIDCLVSYLAAAMRQLTVARIAETLVETYLGRDAGRRVLRGAIARGTADKIRAVLWFSDLKGFTRLVDTQPPKSIIPLLNDYADVLVSAVHRQGGQVLKFIGDGLLGTFETGESVEDCRRALAAAEDAFARVAALNARRAAAGLPATGFYLALSIGDVFYGNVGSDDRLDFTVIGPAVNEVTRINGMCRALDQDLVVSAAFAEAAGPARARLLGLGRYALRGVARPQELFTLERGGEGPT
ncbi:MAG: adenylate/guanylate cyclase domain-containing protein [Dongiaceae bacterium]